MRSLVLGQYSVSEKTPRFLRTSVFIPVLALMLVLALTGCSDRVKLSGTETAEDAGYVLELPPFTLSSCTVCTGELEVKSGQILLKPETDYTVSYIWFINSSYAGVTEKPEYTFPETLPQGHYGISCTAEARVGDRTFRTSRQCAVQHYGSLYTLIL